MECGIKHVFFHVNMPNEVGVWHPRGTKPTIVPGWRKNC